MDFSGIFGNHQNIRKGKQSGKRRELSPDDMVLIRLKININAVWGATLGKYGKFNFEQLRDGTQTSHTITITKAEDILTFLEENDRMSDPAFYINRMYHHRDAKGNLIPLLDASGNTIIDNHGNDIEFIAQYLYYQIENI
ncbi:MAG: hypothetical protein GF364_02140 [Candidatus Lokiarchaeota archaeon]|nr:hypothetical protein [Candidatus Lokiarchaeota archaeon]